MKVYFNATLKTNCLFFEAFSRHAWSLHPQTQQMPTPVWYVKVSSHHLSPPPILSIFAGHLINATEAPSWQLTIDQLHSHPSHRKLTSNHSADPSYWCLIKTLISSPLIWSPRIDWHGKSHVRILRHRPLWLVMLVDADEEPDSKLSFEQRIHHVSSHRSACYIFTSANHQL